MSKFFIAVLLLCSFQSIAQLTNEQRIQDSIIGWWSNNHWDRHWVSPITPVGKKKEQHINNMVQWMKKSYNPVGGLGTVTRYMDERGYGVKFMVWNVSYQKPYLDANGNFKPVSEEQNTFFISTNHLFGANAANFINKPGVHLFTWQMDGHSQHNDVSSKKDALRPKGIHPNASKYITVRNNWQSITLAPNNKMPIEPVTKGEYLQLADKALAQKRQTVNDHDKIAIDRIRKNIAVLKEKYKDNLNEEALLRNQQPDKSDFDFSDPFELSAIQLKEKRYYPLYKITPDALTKLAAAEPLWVTIAVPFFTKEDGNQLYELYTSITENINYDYIYDYFFNHDKVKGIAYRPANEEQLQARLDAYRNKIKHKTTITEKKLPEGMFFMDDFSTETIGQEPKNWFFRTTGNNRCYVVTLPGEKGNWISLGHNTPFSPALLKRPLPENFTLELDLATDAGFSGSTGGSLQLVFSSKKPTEVGTVPPGGNGVSVEFNIISGNETDLNSSNYGGIIRTQINANPSVNNENNSEGIYETSQLKEFTNKKTSVHLTIKFKDGLLEIFVNNKRISSSNNYKLRYGGDCKVCGVPSGTVFYTVYFRDNKANASDAKTYISNIKITQ